MTCEHNFEFGIASYDAYVHKITLFCSKCGEFKHELKLFETNN